MYSNHVYLLHQLRPGNDGNMDSRLVGKFMIDGDQLHHLCDYEGVLESCTQQGKLDQMGQRALERLMGASYYNVEKKPDPMQTTTKGPADIAAGAQEAVVDAGDPNGGVVNEVPVGVKFHRPPSVFDYVREGMDKPHTVEIHGKKVLLDGNVLDDDEADVLLANVRQGLAEIRYRRPQIDYQQGMEQPVPMAMSERVRKTESVFFQLAKSEGLAGSLQAMRDLVDAGHLSFEQYENVRRELYHDEMVPSIGNKRAFNEHLLAEGRGGVHIMLDANDFKSINDELSHDHGDQAIRAIGNSLRRAVDKHVPGEAKVHRFGGDEFHVHVPSHEHAAKFLRGLRQELEALPPVGGTHKLSVSAGVGLDKDSADAALKTGAKGQKMAAIAALGGDPTARVGKVRAPHALYASSSVPGYEGPVPTAQDQMTLARPGEAQKMVDQAAKLHSGEAPPAAPAK